LFKEEASFYAFNMRKIFTPEKKMIGEYGECTKDEISFYFLCITQRLSASSSGHMTAADGEVS
jgi:hypothetical protein